MNIITIEKAIALLNGAQLEELRDLLVYEREKAIFASEGRKMKIAPAVKNVLGKTLKNRPILSTVMHDKKERPFICNGFLLVRWFEEQPELKGFPQTPSDSPDSINADNIMLKKCECEARPVDENDRLIVENIDKYIKLYNKEKKDRVLPVEVFGKSFDAYLLRDFINIIGKDFEEVYTALYGYGTFSYKPSCVYKDDLEAMILPLRVTNEDTKEASCERTRSFLEQLKA